MEDALFKKYLTKADNLFVEVGAYDGVSWSPCVPLIEAGWHGIMVEPNPETFLKLQANRGANSKLTLVNAAIGAEAGAGMLYEGGSLSTLKLDKLRLYNDLPPEEGWHVSLDPNITHACQIMTLDQLLEDAASAGKPSRPSVISIDAEGSEMDVLAGFSIDLYRPKLFIIETHEGHHQQRLAEDFQTIQTYLLQHGYQNVGCDYTNSFYWRGDA